MPADSQPEGSTPPAASPFKKSCHPSRPRPSAARTAPNKKGGQRGGRASAPTEDGRRSGLRAEVTRREADGSVMAAAATSPALKRLDLRDPAALFETHGAEEIRGLERQVRAEIEHKKEELRQMVGERYRDLIEAADTIGQMRRCAEGLVDAVKATDQYCARLREAGSAATLPPRDPQVSPARLGPPPALPRLTSLAEGRACSQFLDSLPGGGNPAVLRWLLIRHSAQEPSLTSGP